MQPRSRGSRPAGTDRRETWERAHGTYSQAYTIEIELLSKLLTYLLHDYASVLRDLITLFFVYIDKPVETVCE